MENNLTMAEFQPAEAQLTELAEKAKTVDVTNIKQVHDVRIELRDTRIALVKKGKELRDGALQFQKAVISKEKDLLAIITPEEERLDLIEEADKQKKEIEKRRAELPSRLIALSSIGDTVATTDDFILSMDDNAFNAYRLTRIEAKLNNDKLAAEAKQRENDRIASEKLAEERKAFEAEKREADEKRRAEQTEIDKEKARLAGIEQERVRQEAIKKADLERIEKEAQLKEAAEKHAREDRDFKIWLTSIQYNSETDKIVNLTEGKMELWRRIDTYKPKN